MAYSAEQWERTKAFFESGEFSLSEISAKTGINKSQISRKAKMQQWQHGRNADYVESKVILATKKATETQQALQILDDIADAKIRQKELTHGTIEAAVKLMQNMVIENKTIEKINCGEGVQNFEPRELNTTDLKNIVTSTIEAGKAFGVIDTQSSININNTNAQQNNIQENNLTVTFK
jgi:ribosomal protein L15